MLTTNIESFYSETPWVTIDDFLSIDELSHLKNSLMARSLQESNLMDAKGKLITNKHRISKISFIPQTEKEYDWLFQKIIAASHSLNNQFFHYDLYGFDYMQYSEYDSVENGRYNWHVDSFMGANSAQAKTLNSMHRKISVTLLLNNDFSGGEFQVTLDGGISETNIPLTAGSLVAFPSFVCHRVADVTKGIRKSMTCWVVGPKFR